MYNNEVVVIIVATALVMMVGNTNSAQVRAYDDRAQCRKRACVPCRHMPFLVHYLYSQQLYLYYLYSQLLHLHYLYSQLFRLVVLTPPPGRCSEGPGIHW